MSVFVYLSHGFLPMESMCQGIAQVSSHRIVRRAITAYGPNDYESCSACVVFGARSPMDRVLTDQRAHRTPVLVVDLGYVKRGNIGQARTSPHDVYWSVNLNGLNGWGDPPRSPMPPDRWKALRQTVRPWQTGGEHILVCGQKPHDAAIDGVDPGQWLHDTVTHLRTLTDRPIRWRPHPEDLTNRRRTIPGGTQSTSVDLHDDLRSCYATVALNSNALVESLLAGVPIFIAGRGSVCAGMGHTELTEETLSAPLRPDREQFFADLAYRQWTIPEMAEGLPWLHLMENTAPASAISTPPKKRRGRTRKPSPVSASTSPRPDTQISPPTENVSPETASQADREEDPAAFLSPEALLKTVHTAPE